MSTYHCREWTTEQPQLWAQTFWARLVFQILVSRSSLLPSFVTWRVKVPQEYPLLQIKTNVNEKWNLYLGDTLGTKASVPWMVVGMGSVNNQWRVQPLIFRPNWGPKGRKNVFWRPGPPLSKGLDDRLPPYLRVWMTAPPPTSSQGLDLALITNQQGQHKQIIILSLRHYMLNSHKYI